MEHAHSRGLRVHRDIKPENLLLGHGQLQITDFGIASAAPLEWSPSPAATEQQRIAGTPPYMPPEQWGGGKQDFRTDVYAFGIVLHELVFGRYPWPISTAQELRTAHFKGSRSLPPHPLNSVIARCIAIAPEDRFQTPQDLLAAIAVTADQLSLHLPPKPQPLDEHREELFARASLSATANREHALAAAQILTEKWPGFSKGWTQLGRIHLEANELQKALEATQRALKLDETRSPPWNNLGVIYSRLEDHDRAISALKRALVCDAQNSGAMSNMATVLTKLGKFREAISVLQQATKIAPDKPHLWVNLGSAQQLFGQTTLANVSFERALQLTPREQRKELAAKIAESKASTSDAAAVVDVGQLLKDGKLEIAVPLLIEATNREPRNANIWHNLSLAYLDLGQNQHAWAALLRLWELEPASSFAAWNLMRIATQSQNWAEAGKWCDKLAELPGMLVESIAQRAKLLSEQGLKSDARKLLLTAIQDHPNEPALFEMFGDLALKGGAPAAAVQRGYGPALQILAGAGRQGSSLYTRIERKHRAALDVAFAEGSLIRKDAQPGDA
jgi:tetratricopeptide (TPR) repeat protein